jgi:hypothetical protein
LWAIAHYGVPSSFDDERGIRVTQADDLFCHRHFLLAQLNDFLNEIHQIACLEPSIVERIDEDLDLHAKKKKLLRLAGAQFLAGQTPDLPKLQLQLRELKLDEIELETGRPRTEAYIAYLFLMLRGWTGGCKDQQARLLLEESITLKLWLEHLGLQLPPAP